ncbi:MAG: RloB family protein [Prevotella sp.]
MKNKYLVRSRRYERQEPLRDSRKIYIYCEGNKREFDYFRFFCGLSSNVNIIPIPSKDGKTDPEKLMEAAREEFGINSDVSPKFTLDVSQQDNVWFVIDTDSWGSKITDLRNFCKSQNAGLDNEAWYVSQSNPSFEIWLYYHKFSEKPVKNDVDKYSSIKEFVDAQIPGGFDSRKHPAMIEAAIQNAKATYEEENQVLKLYSTEVFKLGQVILPFVKDIL